MTLFKSLAGIVDRRALGYLGILMGVIGTPLANAAEKDGLLVDIQKRIIQRNDRGTNVDRTMALKLDVTNKSMTDNAAGEVTYSVLIQRWGFYEKAAYDRYEGTVPLEALKAANKTGLFLGEFRISGHMHGTSEMHVDQFVAWKVVIKTSNKTGDKEVSFSSPRFEALNKQATKKELEAMNR